MRAHGMRTGNQILNDQTKWEETFTRSITPLPWPNFFCDTIRAICLR